MSLPTSVPTVAVRATVERAVARDRGPARATRPRQRRAPRACGQRRPRGHGPRRAPGAPGLETLDFTPQPIDVNASVDARWYLTLPDLSRPRFSPLDVGLGAPKRSPAGKGAPQAVTSGERRIPSGAVVAVLGAAMTAVAIAEFNQSD